MALTLADLRTRVLFAVRGGDAAYPPSQIDVALQQAIDEAALQTHCRRVVGTVTLTAYDPRVTVSSLTVAGVTATDFLPGRLIDAQIGYHSRGTWSAALGSVAVNDLVQGDGSPDSSWYVCTAAHTAASDNEPPNDSYWSLVQVPTGTPLTIRAVPDLLDFHRGSGPWYIDRSRYYDESPLATPGRPHSIGFGPELGQAWVYPTPEMAYPLRLYYWRGGPTWTPGTSATISFDLPDEVLSAAAQYGAPAHLMHLSEDSGRAMTLWRLYENRLRELRQAGATNVGATLRLHQFPWNPD